MGSQNGAKGKRYKPRLYDITFPDDSPFADLEAKVKGASLDTFLELMSVADLAQDAADGVTVTEAHKKAIETLVREFSALVHWWNVDEVVTADGGDAVRQWAASLLEAHGTIATREAVDDVIARLVHLPVPGEAGEEVVRSVAPDEAGLRSQDFAMVMAVFDAWTQRFSVAPPLPNGSGPGQAELPDLADIPVETLSPASPSSS